MESKHYSVNAYRIKSDPYSIMAEIYKNGPVEVSFTVYEVSNCFMPHLAQRLKNKCNIMN